jgi:anti-sigma regulatory factor (Ser/Thr protein kinase)
MQTLASLSLAPGPDAVPKALDWLDSIAEHQSWPKRMAFKLSLCLDEALTNIVMYGFNDLQDDAHAASITLAVGAHGQRITLDIADNGIPFDPTQNSPRDLAVLVEEASIGGHGMRLMRHYLEDIQYRRACGQNHLRLTAAPDPDGT